MAKIYDIKIMKAWTCETFKAWTLPKPSQQRTFWELCEPGFDMVRGHGAPIVLESLRKAGLETDNGLGWLRAGVSILERLFIIKRFRGGGGDHGKIIGLQIMQWRREPRSPIENNHYIPQCVRDYYLKENKCSFCGCKLNKRDHKNLDHRNGRYDIPGYNPSDVSNYQVLCHHCNLEKRTRCIACRAKCERFDARRIPGEKLGWQSGGRKYLGTCVGCILNGFKEWRENMFIPAFLKQIPILLGLQAADPQIQYDTDPDMVTPQEN